MAYPIIKYLALPIIFCAVVLLIGLRFDASWAGGDGYRPQGVAQLVQVVNVQQTDCPIADTVKRGEHLKTCAGVYAEYTVGETHILLDENTDLVLEDARGKPPVLAFLTGRIVTKGPTALTIRQTKLETDGSATFVHYSWENRLDARAITGSVIVTQPPKTHGIAQNNAATVDTLPPTDEPSETLFDITANNLIAFYDWAL